MLPKSLFTLDLHGAHVRHSHRLYPKFQLYNVPSLPPGKYPITVEDPGFEKLIKVSKTNAKQSVSWARG